MLGQAEIGGRPIRFGTLTEAPRLWVAFADTSPPVFGYLSGLVGERLSLQVTETAHLPWTREADHTEQLKSHGLEVWRAAQRWCEG